MSPKTSRQSTDLFHLVVDSVEDFAVFTTDMEGRVVSWNPGVERILGFTEEEFIGLHASVIFTPEDREQGIPEQEMLTAAAEGRAQDKRWHVRRDGSRFWGDGMLMLLRDEAGGLHGFAKIMRDDTERKLAEEGQSGRPAILTYAPTLVPRWPRATPPRATSSSGAPRPWCATSTRPSPASGL